MALSAAALVARTSEIALVRCSVMIDTVVLAVSNAFLGPGMGAVVVVTAAVAFLAVVVVVVVVVVSDDGGVNVAAAAA